MAPRLDTLPPELFLDILDYLAPSAHISLSHVDKRFKFLVPKRYLRRRGTPGCERTAIDRFRQELILRKEGKRLCLLCNGIFDNTWFRGLVPICRWHNAQFEEPGIPRYVENAVRDRLLARGRLGVCWVALKRDVCLHRFTIRKWDRPNPDCCGRCMDCGHFEVECRVRVAPAGDVMKSWENSKDGRFMLESDKPASKSSGAEYLIMAFRLT